jgi:hypothetical protein
MVLAKRDLDEEGSHRELVSAELADRQAALPVRVVRITNDELTGRTIAVDVEDGILENVDRVEWGDVSHDQPTSRDSAI